MPEDALPPSLQESILAALVFDERWGALIATQIEVRHFDDTYRDIAERILAYRRRYGRPPGRTHLDDMFGKILAEGRHPRMRRILFGLSDIADSLNGEYVANRVNEFIRQQTIKSALVDASARYQQGGPDAIPEVEHILYDALKSKVESFDPGIFLNDTSRSLAFLDYVAAEGYKLGIVELDRIGFTMAPKELLLYIGPKGTGKTWFTIHCGKQALLQRAKVVHVSLEFSKELAVGRYYQSLFGAARDPDKTDRSVLEFDKLGRLTGWKTRRISPGLDWTGRGARRELMRKIKPWGVRLGRLVVVDFPSGQLTIPKLESYLDYLELEHRFIPTVLIVDYPALMQLDRRNLRIDLGRTMVDLRGLAVQRNLALIAPHQGNRSSLRAKKVRSDMAAEDITVINTADNVLSYSQTKAEERFGLARLSVEHARNVKGGADILITQSYTTGQYVLESALLNQNYWDKIREVAGGDDDT